MWVEGHSMIELHRCWLASIHHVLVNVHTALVFIGTCGIWFLISVVSFHKGYLTNPQFCKYRGGPYLILLANDSEENFVENLFLM